MLPLLLLTAVAATPSGSLSFGTGMRYGVLGLRGELPINDELAMSAAIGLPPMIYGWKLRRDLGLEQLVPSLDHALRGWPPLSVSLRYGLPVGPHILHAALAIMFLKGDENWNRPNWAPPWTPYTSTTSIAFSVLFGAELTLYGPVFLDVALGPAYTFQRVDDWEEEFSRWHNGVGFDWALGVGYRFE